MQPTSKATEKTVKSPLTGREYTIRRIGWTRRTRLVQKAGGDLTTFMCEMIKACVTTPKITDADLDNPNGLPSAEWDWVCAEITKLDLGDLASQAPSIADTLRRV